MPKIITSDMFIAESIKYWGDRYDYSLVSTNWVNMTTKIPVKCNLCNNTWNITPSSHASNSSHKGCKKCNGFKPSKMKLDDFIDKATKIHGDKFDYSTIPEWNGANHKVRLLCNKCKKYINIRAKNHISNTPSGCIHCQPMIVGDKLKLSYNEFASRFYKTKDPNIYKIESYTTGNEKAIITCLICHDSIKLRSDHALTQKHLCSCIYKYRISLTDFIQKATCKHNNLYTYTNTQYNGYNTKTTVTCKTHGDFYITPSSHLAGSGCAKCQTSKGESRISYVLDNLKIQYTQEQSFSECKYKRSLFFDFYIHALNLCIEYNGEHHYKPVRFKGVTQQQSIDKFKLQKIKDEIKHQYCITNNMKLLVIPYWCYSDINNIIESYVKTHQNLQLL